MPPDRILSELRKLAGRMGIVVREDVFDLKVIEGPGGLCWLRGRAVVVIDQGLPLLDKIGVLARALAYFDIEAIYLPQSLRVRLETERRAARG